LVTEERGRAQHRTVGASPRDVRFARQLRKDMSLPEVLLWRELRGKPMGLKFRRQFPVLGYVADFACVEVRLLIEIDGIVHDMGDQPARDVERDAILTNKGWKVLRIAATDVLRDVSGMAGSIVALAESIRPLRPCGAPPRSGEDLQ
jgi:very-short-patch-repair endonuclease